MTDCPNCRTIHVPTFGNFDAVWIVRCAEHRPATPEWQHDGPQPVGYVFDRDDLDGERALIRGPHLTPGEFVRATCLASNDDATWWRVVEVEQRGSWVERLPQPPEVML